MQKDLSRRDQIAIWQPIVPIIAAQRGVTAVSPQIRRSAYVEQEQALAPVGVIGVMPGKLSGIADIYAAITDGSSNLPTDGVLKVSRLAEDLRESNGAATTFPNSTIPHRRSGFLRSTWETVAPIRWADFGRHRSTGRAAAYRDADPARIPSGWRRHMGRRARLFAELNYSWPRLDQ
ncbi:hypothetical protein [Alteraurantiacibacter palmitatis]|uniref:hypothetical protein n=1 Tax=Alteraurantiacibacter palmitatis TaxID=2054628 RepID=UPI0030164710